MTGMLSATVTVTAAAAAGARDWGSWSWSAASRRARRVRFSERWWSGGGPSLPKSFRLSEALLTPECLTVPRKATLHSFGWALIGPGLNFASHGHTAIHVVRIFFNLLYQFFFAQKISIIFLK